MSLATALQDQLTHNPWPASAPHVIFLLDTTRRFERQVREHWTATHDSHASSQTVVLLDLRDDRKPLIARNYHRSFSNIHTPWWRRSGCRRYKPRGAPAADLDRCMNCVKRAYLQRQISNEASIGKMLIANAWKMLMSRGLIDEADGRSRQAEALNQLIRRLKVIRALSIADRGAHILRAVACETL